MPRPRPLDTTKDSRSKGLLPDVLPAPRQRHSFAKNRDLCYDRANIGETLAESRALEQADPL